MHVRTHCTEPSRTDALTRTHAWTRRLTLMGALAVTGTIGCVDEELPTGVVDPVEYQTEASALRMYDGMMLSFHTAMGNTPVPVGLLTDELESYKRGGSPLSGSGTDETMVLDMRKLPEKSPAMTDKLYDALHATRAGSGTVRAAIAKYAPAKPTALRSRLLFMEAMSEVLLADLYCSGVPLSTVDFEKDYTFRPPSTTVEVYQHAVSLLDTALTLVGDSTSLEYSIRVLQGRALLALGEYARAGQVVASVPDNFEHSIPIASVAKNAQSTANAPGADVRFFFAGSVADREGPLGMAFRTAADPRVVIIDTAKNEFQFRLAWLLKYKANTAVPLVIASGVEARLIQAEAALQASDYPGWLGHLNHLRSTAISPAMAALTDPGNEKDRIDMLFSERGMWLFFTAHRQGDLRRLIRQYRRDPAQVYPTGPYTTPGMGTYGTDVNAPIPVNETYNPYFKGCLSRNA